MKIVFGPGGYAAKEPLVLCVQSRVESASGFFSSLLNGRNVSTKVQMRIETAVLGPNGLQATEETPLGSSWSCAASP